jgi:glycosyltransferase involved in cell wall biosynthesis
VVLEAMSAGVPVVATSAGGVPEIMEDGVTGLIVPPRNPRLMAEGLARVLRDETLRLRLGAAGRDHVSHNFTPESYSASLAAFYQEVLEAWRRGKR